MPFLIDARFEEVASLVQSNSLYDVYLNQSNPGFKFYGIGSQYGFTDQVQGAGIESAATLAALGVLVRSGQVSVAEAEAYLRQAFPDQNWTGGTWGDQSAGVAAQSAQGASFADQLEAAGVDPEAVSPRDMATQIQQAIGGSPGAQAPSQSQPVTLDDLPGEYDSDEIQQTLDSSLQRVSARVNSALNGNIRYRAHTIPGQAIVPGTLPFAALDQRLVREALESFPGADDTIELQIAPVQTMDRYVVDSSGKKGPGRIWRVTRATLPANWNSGPGPLRYRLVVPGMKFGVCSIEIESLVSSELLVNYGIILTGIPAFGRKPEHLLATRFVGDGPSSYATEDESTTIDPGLNPHAYTNARRLFQAQPKVAFQDSLRAFVDPFGVDTVLVPGASDPLEAPGFLFGLIQGRSAQEVYQELCTRSTPAGLRFLSDGAIQGESVPRGTKVRPMTSGQAVSVDTGANNVTVHEEGDDLSTENIFEGIPFLYDDCRRLVPTTASFSMMIMFDYQKHSNWVSSSWTGPHAWDTFGLQTVSEQGREWKLDVIVQ